MAQCVIVSEPGGPDTLQVVERDVPAPGAGEIQLRHSAVGVNFIDVYFRTGLYRGPLFPFVLGMEGAGVVERVGSGVNGLQAGDRVAYAGVMGGYSAMRVIPAERVVKLPPHVSDETAAAVMLKGMTAEYLLRRSFAVQPGHTLLFHAAAGGVGSIACQWGKALGARVIGTVGSAGKVEIARKNGCDAVVSYDDANWPQKVRDLTGGVGVDVVYDGVGQATFHGSLACLKPRGMAVVFGQSSGKVPPFELTELVNRGSLFLTRPKLADYTATHDELEASAAALFSQLQSANLQVTIGARFPLKDAAAAHRALEARSTTGSTVLHPSP